MKVKAKKSVSKAVHKKEQRTGKCLQCETCPGFTASGDDSEICDCGHPESEHEKARLLFAFTITVCLKSGQSFSIRKDDPSQQLQIERDFAGFLSESPGAPKFGQFEGYPADSTNRVNVSVVVPFGEVCALSVTRKDLGAKL